MGQQRQGDVAVPARPAAHLVVVQADLGLGLLEALLDCPPGPGHPDQAEQGGFELAPSMAPQSACAMGTVLVSIVVSILLTGRRPKGTGEARGHLASPVPWPGP